MTLTQLTERFNAAFAAAEVANEDYKLDRVNRVVLARFIRALRRCDRLRRQMAMMLETGRL